MLVQKSFAFGVFGDEFGVFADLEGLHHRGGGVARGRGGEFLAEAVSPQRMARAGGAGVRVREMIVVLGKNLERVYKSEYNPRERRS